MARPERLRTAYQHAVLRNRDDVARELDDWARRPTSISTTSPWPRSRAASARRSSRDAPDYDQQEVADPRARGLAGRRALRPGLPGVVGGSPVASLLAHAAWSGEPDRVRVLLAAGATPDALGAAVFGSHGCRAATTSAWRSSSSRRARSSSRSTRPRPTARSPSGSQHDSHAEPERHVIRPLPALRQRGDGREEAAQDDEVQTRDGEPAERRQHRLVASGSTAPSTPAHPSESARCTGAPAARSTGVRSLARQQHLPERAPAFERVAALEQRGQGRREAGHDRSGHPGGEDVERAAADHRRDTTPSSARRPRRPRGRRRRGRPCRRRARVQRRFAPEAEGEMGIVAGAFPRQATVIAGEGHARREAMRGALIRQLPPNHIVLRACVHSGTSEQRSSAPVSSASSTSRRCGGSGSR